MGSWVRNYSNGSFYNNWHLQLDYILNSQDSASNVSNITLNLYTYADSSSYSQNGLWDPRIYINGGQVAGSTTTRTITGSSLVLMASWTGNVSHNSDGTLTINIGDYMNAPANEATFAQTGWTLPTIPRYATITNFTVTNVNDQGFTLNLAADVTCDMYSWWLNGGAHNDVSAVGTSFTIPVANLASNKGYTINAAVRRQSSALWTNSGTLNTTTARQDSLLVFGEV